MRVEFAIAPVAWSRPRLDLRYGRGHGFRARDLVRFQTQVRDQGMKAMESFRCPIFEGPLSVSMHFYVERGATVKRPHPCVVPDLSNYCKAAEDALNGVFWKDDAQICQLYLTKNYGETAHFFVEVTPFPGGPP